ncbi:MAG TPA: hypothetical protein VFG22_01980 [Polyangiales bacterium]|nr:hypothetical protein [Polyangiales bacterium]
MIFTDSQALAHLRESHVRTIEIGRTWRNRNVALKHEHEFDMLIHHEDGDYSGAWIVYSKLNGAYRKKRETPQRPVT